MNSGISKWHTNPEYASDRIDKEIYIMSVLMFKLFDFEIRGRAK